MNITVKETVAALKGIPTREALMETLHKEVVEVTFTKLNGETRTMPCTLIPAFLPTAKKDDPMSQKKIREITDKVVAAWAIQSKGFRSFRYDRVTKVEVIDRQEYKARLGSFWDDPGNGTEDGANY
jgi:hypothetical protein|tara:strand:+ start:8983 stop:9360 length:378 start_codon:yes stop_codon:yes gene_type:complete